MSGLGLMFKSLCVIIIFAALCLFTYWFLQPEIKSVENSLFHNRSSYQNQIDYDKLLEDHRREINNNFD